MHTTPIILELEEKAAQIYEHIPDNERKKLQQLFSLLLSEHHHLPSLLEWLLDTISLRAQQRGLTPEVIEKILKVEDYVDFLLQKHQPIVSQSGASIQREQQTLKQAKRSEQPLIGLWKDREEMQDVEKYVQQLRKPRY